MEFNFEPDCDFDFAHEEDFGLAKQFTNAPLGTMFESSIDENKNVD